MLVAAVIAVVGSSIGYQLWIGGSTMPVVNEGFAGPSKIAGSIDCLHSSSDAAQLYDMLSSVKSSTEEGPDDLRELKLILGKLVCFKRDLMRPSGIVEATWKQPFSTAHDMEPIAETTARCFRKTIPQRDLLLSFDKWNTRGTLLVKRICTSIQLSEAQYAKALKLFKQLITDVSDVALKVCCNSDVKIAGQEGPRMVQGYEPSILSMLREYGGYY